MSASAPLLEVGRRRRYRALDGLRGLAALCVALVHTPAIFQSALSNNLFIRNCSLLVDFFFVLSGFVLTHAHLHRGDSFTSFFLKRVGRLWPLHLAVLTAFVGMECIKFYLSRHGFSGEDAPFTGMNSWSAILTNILLIQALGIHSSATWNFPSWSISVEMWVSMLFIALVLTVRKQLAIISILISVASAFLLFEVATDMTEEIYKWAFFRCCFGFFSGVFLYMSVRQVTPDLGQRLEWPIFLLVVFYIWSHQLGWSSLLAPPLFAGFIYVFAAEGGMLSAWLTRPPLQWLGERSYSIYLTHLFVGLILWRFAKVIENATHFHLDGSPGNQAGANQIPPWWMSANTVFYLVMVLCVSALTYVYIEVPWRKRFNVWAEEISPRRQG